LLRHRSPHTPVFIGRNLGRSGETTRIAELSDLAGDNAEIDMLSVIIVGNSTSRVLKGYPSRFYTPRGYFPDMPR
jgi:precorrin-3B methylase